MGLFVSHQKRGFTLVEIVVAVGIVAVLSTVVIMNIQDARKGSRDTQRLSDLQQIQLALRMYKDANGRYPDMGCGRTAPTHYWTGASSAFGSCTKYIAGLEDYLDPLPLDPKTTATGGYAYSLRNGGADYKLVVWTTVESKLIPRGSPYAYCPATGCAANTFCDATQGVHSYSIWHDTVNPVEGIGAECW